MAFTVTLLDRHGRLASNTNAYWFAEETIDGDGVTSRTSPDGRVYHNISSIAFQAMESPFKHRPLDIDVLVDGRTTLSDNQLLAFRWLDAHHAELANGGHQWYQDFEYDYNNLRLTTPWPSAFGQAAVIQALLSAGRTTGDARWLERAIAASLAFDVDVDQGGLRGEVDGRPFYEEVPLARGYSPHVLNGHLYSVVVLLELHRATGDPRIGRLAAAGLATARETLHLFDQGSWTRYDLRPRLHEVPLCVAGPAGEHRVESVELRAPHGAATVLRMERGFREDQRASAFGRWTRDGDRRGWGIAGPAFVALALPDAEIRDWSGHPGWVLNLRYRGEATSPPALGASDWRTGLEGGYCRLACSGVVTKGDLHIASYRLGIEDLGWCYLQRHYVEWHTRLLQRLFDLTADPILRRFQARWTGYLATYDSDLGTHRRSTTETAEAMFRLDDRVWGRRTEPHLQEAVLQALSGLPSVLRPRDVVLALLRFTYQRLAPGTNPHRDPGDALTQGTASSADYAAVFRALSGEVGLRCRTRHLREISTQGEHVLCEVWLEGEWCAVDPMLGTFFTLGDDAHTTLASLDDLREEGASPVICWELAGREALRRGRPPAPLPTPDPTDAFVAAGPHPSGYPIDIAFGTAPVTEGSVPNVETNFDVSLQGGGIELGEVRRTPASPAWSGLTSLVRDDGSVVSLHELGLGQSHAVAQRFHLSGLEPGRVYGFEVDLCHRRRATIPEPSIVVEGAETLTTRPQATPARHALRARAWFRAAEPRHELLLALPKGRALLSALRFFPTPWRDLPRPCSAGARVLDATAFHAGHGPENALDGVWDDDYVAAVEGTLPNRFTFELEAPITAVTLDLIWNSPTEFGHDFALVALTERGEVTVLEVTSNRPGAGGQSDRFALLPAPPTRRFRFELRRAAGQDRLLLMDLTLRGFQPP